MVLELADGFLLPTLIAQYLQIRAVPLHNLSPERRSQLVQVFAQNRSESIVINGEITITVAGIFDDEVVLAIDAPAWIDVSEQPAETTPHRQVMRLLTQPPL